eukprot:TRINITY_DN45474_c0_g1_i1.p1 TRINITY_DN45474_c0_g1~~TRINITY_DN45474_c0_g1_i1.p1  ORF type:complete len:520 (+),score=62.67 TRINITY_DN45474_c0_g1_i1:151-1710(+)
MVVDPSPRRGCVAFFRGAWLVFLLLVGASIFVNFDSGGTAAILSLLRKGCKTSESLRRIEFQYAYDPAYPCLDEAEEGILCSMPYVGLVVGCPIANRLLSSFSPKKVLSVGLCLNAAATIVFSVMLNKWYLWVAKFVVGLSQSVISVYSPVWVAKFAPASIKTLWFGLMQSACAIGNLAGYAVVSYLVDLDVFYQDAFMIQAFALLAIALLVQFVAKARIDDRFAAATHSTPFGAFPQGGANAEGLDVPSFAQEPRWTNRAIASEHIGVGAPSAVLIDRHDNTGTRNYANDLVDLVNHALREVLVLMKIRLFVSTVFTLCVLCFVVTGIQLWASTYFIIAFERPRSQVTTVFVVVSSSAPILGVVMGSSVVDALGGYDTPPQKVKSCRLLLSWAVLAGVAGIGVAILPPAEPENPSDRRYCMVVAFLWFLLFFGGAMLPAVTGLNMAVVPEELRTAASSWSMMAYNVFGYSLGAYIPGQVALFSSLTVAMQIVCTCSIAGMFGSIASYMFALHAARVSD